MACSARGKTAAILDFVPLPGMRPRASVALGKYLQGGIMKGFLTAASRWLLGACVALASSVASAQPTDAAKAEFQAALQAANKATIAGPADIKLADQAVLKLPQGLSYVPAVESGRLLIAMGNL